MALRSRSITTRSPLPSISCRNLDLQEGHVPLRATARRCATTEAVVKPRRRLKFDPTEPLTFRESLRIERQREERKKKERDAVSANGHCDDDDV